MREKIIAGGKGALQKTIQVCNVLASLSIISGAVLFVFGQRDREIQAATSAWSAISNPRPGISLSNELASLNEGGWFVKKSKLDNLYLVPEIGTKGVSLNGLELKGASLTSVIADRSNINGAKISDSDLTETSFVGSVIDGSSFKSTEMIKANLEGAFIVNSEFEGVLTGANFQKSFVADTHINTSIPEASGFDRASSRYAQEYRFHASNAFFRDSSISVSILDGYKQCGLLEFNEAELYYTKIETPAKSGSNVSPCFIFLSKAWVLGTSLSGQLGLDCDHCVVGYSDINVGADIVINQLAVDNSIGFNYYLPRIVHATVFKSKISGTAKNVDLSGTKFVKADLTRFNFDGANLSDAEFDNYDSEKARQKDNPDELLQIFYRGYSRAERSLKMSDWDFDADVDSKETEDQVRARYPSTGLAGAWAWRDRPPKGIPGGLQGPVLCDPSLRTGGDEQAAKPDGC
ncbi:pentapeptide repeat-containing protein [Rhizobium sp. Nf11,1]|uniref:pentapeptide repeat-containing protein n=1 Tax=Rhizobium sp. Nf11,1 TaxID=3404923 RepID=UPI003D3352C2